MPTMEKENFHFSLVFRSDGILLISVKSLVRSNQFEPPSVASGREVCATAVKIFPCVLSGEIRYRENEVPAEIYSASSSAELYLWTSTGGAKQLRRSVALPLPLETTLKRSLERSVCAPELHRYL